MNRLILFVFSIIVGQVIYAQGGDLMVQGSGNDMHLVHTVTPKENWYSVGRIYNISPKEIAPYNHLTIDQPLSIGQQLNIPLTAANFSKKKTAINNDEVWIPLHQAKTVVGYLKVKATLSPLADKTNTVASPTVAKKEPVTAPEPAKQETKIAPPVEKKTEPVAEVKTTGTNFKGGLFKSQYESSGKTISGTAGIFKSTSGWQDGKYYALINNIPVGTIVKITNPSSGKSVYAKVLGNLADMKENAGLEVRVSDAAAGELGVEGKFEAEVKY